MRSSSSSSGEEVRTLGVGGIIKGEGNASTDGEGTPNVQNAAETEAAESMEEFNAVLAAEEFKEEEEFSSEEEEEEEQEERELFRLPPLWSDERYMD
jgi:hypothetical protein